MTAALYLLRAGVKLAWLEKLAPGGQVLKTEVIENYPGFPSGIAGWELADVFAKHLEGFEFEKHSTGVTAIRHSPGDNVVVAEEGELRAKAVVVCTGAEYKHLDVPGEHELMGRGVSYCALCDGNFFRGQTVGVVGGGNTALEESLYLTKLVDKLYLIHRRDAFRGDKIYQDKVLAHPKIEIVYNSVVTEIEGPSEVRGVQLRNRQTGESSRLDMQGLFIFIGLTPLADFIPAELNRDREGFVITDTEMRTNLPGVFAAGDVRSKRCRQVTTAVGDGATAANSAFHYLEQLHA